VEGYLRVLAELKAQLEASKGLNPNSCGMEFPQKSGQKVKQLFGFVLNY
jgi:hypothetical protein